MRVVATTIFSLWFLTHLSAAQSYTCAFKWGVNLDLGYCGWATASLDDPAKIELEVHAVATSASREELPEMGEADACNGYSPLAQLSAGEIISVPATCVTSDFELLKWGGKLDRGYAASVIPGSFSGEEIGLSVKSVDPPRFGGLGNVCSGQMEIKNLEGEEIRVPTKCIGHSLMDEILRTVPEIAARSN